MFLVRVALASAIFSLSAAGRTLAAAEKVEQLSPRGYVNDFAGAMGAESREKITALSEELDRKAEFMRSGLLPIPGQPKVIRG